MKTGLKRASTSGREIERIVLPKASVAYMKNLAASQNETNGFLYGQRIGKDVYLTMPFIYNECFLPDEERNTPTGATFIGERGEEYIKLHNHIVRSGKKSIENFCWVGMHTHPRVGYAELEPETRERIMKTVRGLKSIPKHEDIFDLFSIGELSDGDKTFAKRYSSYGLSILSTGDVNDFRRTQGIMKVPLALKGLLAGMAYKKEHPKDIFAFQNYQNECIPIELSIAENCPMYRDEERCKRLTREMVDVNRTIVSYIKKYGQMAMQLHPEETENVSGLFKKILPKRITQLHERVFG